MVRHIQDKEIDKMTTMFQSMDKRKTGFIEEDELKTAMNKAGLDGSAKNIKVMMKNIDFEENKKINYTEFLAATIDDTYLTDERLKGVFNTFDVDNSGAISVENMRQTFSKFGKEITQSEIEEVLAKHDKNEQKSINFEEFKAMIKD